MEPEIIPQLHVLYAQCAPAPGAASGPGGLLVGRIEFHPQDWTDDFLPIYGRPYLQLINSECYETDRALEWTVAILPPLHPDHVAAHQLAIQLLGEQDLLTQHEIARLVGAGRRHILEGLGFGGRP